jgi:hypothetical protein
VDDIVEIMKRGVSVARSVMGYVAGMGLTGTGIEIRVKSGDRSLDSIKTEEKAKENVVGEAVKEDLKEGESLVFTNVLRREQLFIRLISMGNQQWETM